MLMGFSTTAWRSSGQQHSSSSSKVEEIFAPIRTKMKVLQKFKRRMGLAPRTNSGSGGTNNLPPLLFHQVHGDNIRIIRDGFVARRAESFCKGVTFTNRPVKVAERVYIKFLEVSSNWSGVIRLGFTCNDPITLRNGLPKYACPDLTNKPGYWAKALAERFCARDTILFFYVTSAGDVHFGIDGEEKGIFLSGVDTRNQLWAMIDVYGNSTEIELLDARQHLNNSRRIISNGITDSSPEVVDRRLITSMQALSVSHGGGSTSPPPGGREADQQHQPPPPPPHYTPLVFHRTRGRNVRLSNDRCIATRSETEFCQGYVFTARPLQLGERILIQVLATETVFLGALALGLTSCDPATLTASDLPDDSDLLLDRPEYWVVSKDVANYPQRGDELTFSITHSGEVQMSKNGSPPVVLMHVDQSLTLWAFLDVYGSTSKIRILGSSIIEPPRSGVTSPLPREEPQQQPPPQIVRASSAALVRPGLRVALPDTRHSELVQLGGAVPGGTVLVVNLPPPQSHPHPHPHQSPPPDSTAATSATLLSTYSHTYIEPVSASSYTTVVDSSSAAAAAANMSNMREWAETSVSAPSGSECSICYERAIDSVLYMCGHMCMCYECAVQQWRGKGGGHCPLCRAVIRDVIRTYKS